MHIDSNGILATIKNRLRQHTNPIVPRGGFLQVAVSEAPTSEELGVETLCRGRFRYSPKTSRDQTLCPRAALGLVVS